MVALSLRGVSKSYPGDVPVHALRSVDLDIKQGDYIAIEGPSGSGKSTLLNQITLLDIPTTGSYQIRGTDMAGRSDNFRAEVRSAQFAFIFQSFHLLAGRTVLENVALGSLYRGLRMSQREDAAVEALQFVGLGEKLDKRTENLSGGERQRVAIARAIASGTPVIVADEPTGNLDTVSGRQVMETLERLNEGGSTLVVVTHDKEVAARAKRRLWVQDGKVTEVDVGSAASQLPPQKLQTSPMTRGRDSRIRFIDAILDAWRGMWAFPRKTVALIMAVALGVGLGLTTLGLSQTARFQVSDLFDAQRNQRVALSSPELEPGTFVDAEATAEVSLQRLRDLRGGESAQVYVMHDEKPVTSRPGVSLELVRGSPIVGVVGGELFAAGVDTGSGDGQSEAQSTQMDSELSRLVAVGSGDVVLGSQLASSLEIGPLLASPTVWVDGHPRRVVGILTDSGLQVGLLEALITSEEDAAQISRPSYANAEVRVLPGAAKQVAEQGPLAWIPSAPELVTVDAPPDPSTMREVIETNMGTMLAVLTGVALLAAVLSLTNAMTTAVLQRTGEFGLRRAIGARRIHIRSLVLTEALFIGAAGGLLGAYLSLLVILAVTIVQSWQPVISPLAIPTGVLGGILVGLLGGLIATGRAARIEPHDALRV